MKWVEEHDGSCPTRGALLSFAEILGVSDDPKRARSADWLCKSCQREVALRAGLCGHCWLREWKEAQATEGARR